MTLAGWPASPGRGSEGCLPAALQDGAPRCRRAVLCPCLPHLRQERAAAGQGPLQAPTVKSTLPLGISQVWGPAGEGGEAGSPCTQRHPQAWHWLVFAERHRTQVGSFEVTAHEHPETSHLGRSCGQDRPATHQRRPRLRCPLRLREGEDWGGERLADGGPFTFLGTSLFCPSCYGRPGPLSRVGQQAWHHLRSQS